MCRKTVPVIAIELYIKLEKTPGYESRYKEVGRALDAAGLGLVCSRDISITVLEAIKSSEDGEDFKDKFCSIVADEKRRLREFWKGVTPIPLGVN